jgi:hypothetical protein
MEKQKLNTTTIYILSVVGFLCCCIGGLGFIPAGIAYFMANSKNKEVQMNPENFENPGAMKTAKTVALVALILNVLYFGLTIYRIATVGWDEMMMQSQQMMEQMGVE